MVQTSNLTYLNFMIFMSISHGTPIAALKIHDKRFGFLLSERSQA
jgi:hypothetical protein